VRPVVGRDRGAALGAVHCRGQTWRGKRKSKLVAVRGNGRGTSSVGLAASDGCGAVEPVAWLCRLVCAPGWAIRVWGVDQRRAGVSAVTGGAEGIVRRPGHRAGVFTPGAGGYEEAESTALGDLSAE